MMKEQTFQEYFAENPEALILMSDSYKFGHWKMYLDGTMNISSYFESRSGAKYDSTVFFGLQYIIKMHLAGVVITQEMIEVAEQFTESHFLGHTEFNRKMWERVVNVHGGKLPIRIKAVPEGMRIPVNNLLMYVEVTDEELTDQLAPLMAPLTNYFETILTHVWGTSNVATISRDIRDCLEKYFEMSVDEADYWKIDYMLHDFGFRGVTCVQHAGLLGSAHLTSFAGTDTPPAITYPMKYYNADMLGYSVNASEHSVMCQNGAENDIEILRSFLYKFPDGIISIVGDSKNIEEFVTAIGTDEEIKNLILTRNGKFVVRPDSPRFDGDTAHDQIIWIADELCKYFPATNNTKTYVELNPKVGIIYGDGLSADQIKLALEKLVDAGYSAATCVFGMGGGLLQKHNRDTQRFAFKCSARKDSDGWHDVYKSPLDKTKSSKKGRLKLIKIDGEFKTVRIEEYPEHEDILVTVFENGELVNELTFEQVRENTKK
jgi:nicotinamide phosphoribosyltransferase